MIEVKKWMDQIRRWPGLLRNFLRNMKLSQKLTSVLMVVVFIQSAVIFGVTYHSSSSAILNNASQMMQNIIFASDHLMTYRYNEIINQMNAFTVDTDVYNLFSTSSKNSYERIQRAESLEKLVYHYFNVPEIYAVNLATSELQNTYNGITLFYERLLDSEFYPQDQGPSALHWIPFFDLSSIADVQIYHLKQKSGLPTFALVKRLDCSKVENELIQPLPAGAEHPTIVISFRPSFYEEVLEQNISYVGYQYAVVAQDGQYIAHTDKNLIGSYASEYERSQNGNTRYIDYREKALVCTIKSNVTNWTTVISIPLSELVSELMDTRPRLFKLLILSFVAMIFALLWIVRSFTVPIRNLAAAISQLGKGDFQARVPVKSLDEIGVLSLKFNEMNHQLATLIRTNYETVLREQAAIIKSLELQLNPHFIYNTLNTINVMAIDADRPDISKIIVYLSSILQYSLNRKDKNVRFEEDLNWLEKYLYIMEMRFPEKFSVYFDIEPELYACIVPRMLLQPLIENAIIHGFQELDSGGIIRIHAYRKENNAYFEVEDNGCGMTEEEQKSIFSQNTGHLGCANLDRRIKLQYGETYGLSIFSVPDSYTRFVVSIPYRR